MMDERNDPRAGGRYRQDCLESCLLKEVIGREASGGGRGRGGGGGRSGELQIVGGKSHVVGALCFGVVVVVIVVVGCVLLASRPPRWPSRYGVRLESGRSGVRIPLATGFFRVESYQWLKHWHSSGYPARRPAFEGQCWDRSARCQDTVTG